MTKYILSCSYGKDSLACLGAIEKLGWKLDGIIHIDEWATDDIPAELPDVVAFYHRADEIIKDRYGIIVEHITAKNPDGSKKTFENCLYRVREKGTKIGELWGFPTHGSVWCNSQLKMRGVAELRRRLKGDVVQYVGIAIDETERLKRIDGIRQKSPIAEIGWTEADCMEWCRKNGLLSPVYDRQARSGCWFCGKQSIDQLRYLYHNHYDLFSLLLKYEKDSPTRFSNNWRLDELDKRFFYEDKGILPMDQTYRRKMLTENNLFVMMAEAERDKG